MFVLSRLQPKKSKSTPHKPPSNAPPTRRLTGRFDSHGSEKFKDEPPPSMFWRKISVLFLLVNRKTHRRRGNWKCQPWFWPSVFLLATLGWFLHHWLYINAFKWIFSLPCRRRQHHFESQMGVGDFMLAPWRARSKNKQPKTYRHVGMWRTNHLPRFVKFLYIYR